jgi:hypothetical protein
MTPLLLHLCCAPCSPWIIQELKRDHAVTAFFYDPNIHPREEYIFRRDEARLLCEKLNVPFLEGEYDAEEWFARTKNLQDEPERGKRCEICFDLRLERTAKLSQEMQFEKFTTVLPVSPHKSFAQIVAAGTRAAKKYGVEFLAGDWKKRDGYLKTARLAQKFNLKRQDYCGCIYSLRNSNSLDPPPR